MQIVKNGSIFQYKKPLEISPVGGTLIVTFARGLGNKKGAYMNHKNSRGYSFIEVVISMVILVFVVGMGATLLQGITRQQAAKTNQDVVEQYFQASIDNFNFISRDPRWFDANQLAGDPIANTYYLDSCDPANDQFLMPVQMDVQGNITGLNISPPANNCKYQVKGIVGLVNTSDGTRSLKVTISYKRGNQPIEAERYVNLLPSAKRNAGYRLRARVVDGLPGTNYCQGVSGIQFETTGLDDVPIIGITNAFGWVTLYGLKESMNISINGTLKPQPHYYARSMDASLKYSNSTLFKNLSFTFPPDITTLEIPRQLGLGGMNVEDGGCPGAFDMFPYGEIKGKVEDELVSTNKVKDYLLHVRPIQQHYWLNDSFYETRTDENGFFSLFAMPGRYYIVPVGTAEANPQANEPNKFIPVPAYYDFDDLDNSFGIHAPNTTEEDPVLYPAHPTIRASLAHLSPTGPTYGGLAWTTGADINNPIPESVFFEALKNSGACHACLGLSEGAVYDSLALSDVNLNDLDSTRFSVYKRPTLKLVLSRAIFVGNKFNFIDFEKTEDTNWGILAFNNPHNAIFDNGGASKFIRGLNGNQMTLDSTNSGGIYAVDEDYIKRNFINQQAADISLTRMDEDGLAYFRNLAFPIQPRTDKVYGNLLTDTYANVTDAIEIAPHSWGQGKAPVLVYGTNATNQKFIVYTGNRGAGIDFPFQYKVIPHVNGFSGIQADDATSIVNGPPSGYTVVQNRGYDTEIFSGGMKPLYLNFNSPETTNSDFAILRTDQLSNMRGQIRDNGDPTLGWDRTLPATLETWGIMREPNNDPDAPGYFTFNYKTMSVPDAANPTTGDQTYNFRGPGPGNDFRLLPSMPRVGEPTQLENGNIRFIDFTLAVALTPPQSFPIYGHINIKEKKLSTAQLPACDIGCGSGVNTPIYNIVNKTRPELSALDGPLYEITYGGAPGTAVATDKFGSPSNPLTLTGVPGRYIYKTPSNIQAPAFKDFTANMAGPDVFAGTAGGVILPPGQELIVDLVVNGTEERFDPMYVRIKPGMNFVDSYAPTTTHQGRQALKCKSPANNTAPWCAPFLGVTGIPAEFYGMDVNNIVEGWSVKQGPTRIQVQVNDSSGNGLDNAEVKIFSSSWSKRKAGDRWNEERTLYTNSSGRADYNVSAGDPIFYYDHMDGWNIKIVINSPGFVEGKIEKEWASAGGAMPLQTINLIPLPPGNPGSSGGTGL